jgi:predicted DNA-binding protein (MmcQ/YjbR family)
MLIVVNMATSERTSNIWLMILCSRQMIQSEDGMVSWDQVQTYCLAKKGVTEDFPFGDNVPVYKVLEKMFALVALHEGFRITLKCDPEQALLLRDMYPAVQGGYYTNKRHWNTITIDGSIPDIAVRPEL